MESCCKEGLPLMAMVMVECTTVGVNVLFKEASSMGLSFYVFTCYSYVVASLLLFPCIFFSNRNLELPANRFALLCRILLLGLFGYLCQICTYKGIMYSSPTLASAMGNLVPAFTFLLAIIFSTQAKVIGTLVSIVGACVVTFYKGPTILLTATTSTPDWIFSSLLLAFGYLMAPIWYILQAQIMKEYPAEIPVVFFFILSAMVISSIFGLIADPNLSSWKLSFDMKLTTVLYSGFFGCIFAPVIHTWGVRLKGPVYVTMFKPLSIVIATIMSSMFLGESLHLGSVIGSVIISIGFYAVVWGKAKEETGEELDCRKTPLLQSKSIM